MILRPARLSVVLAGFGAAALNLYLSVNLSLPSSGPEITVSWEAEAAKGIHSPFRSEYSTRAYGDGYVAMQPNNRGRTLDYDVSVAESGEYTLWARVKWANSCRNLLLVSVNDGQFSTLGNDSAYGAWHWVRGASYSLHRGINTLSVRDTGRFAALREFVQVDRFMLTNWDAPLLVSDEPAKFRNFTFADDFSSDWRRRWASVVGRWEAKDPRGLAYLQHAAKSRALLIAAAPELADYALQTALRGGDGTTQGVVFDYADPGKYSLARIIADGDYRLLEVAVVSQGREEILGQVIVAGRMQGWQTLRIEALGDALRVFLNDREAIQLSRRRGPKYGVGLFGDGEPGGTFDDFILEPIASFSESRLTASGDSSVETVNFDFASRRGLDFWQVVRGNWSIQNGALESGAKASPSIVYGRPLHGRFEVEIDVTWPHDQWLVLHLRSDLVDNRFRIERDERSKRVRVELLRDDELADSRMLEMCEPCGALKLERTASGLSLSIDGTPLLETDVGPDIGSIRFGITASRARISSFRINQSPHFRYSAWDAPVGWEPANGELEIGHQFASLRSAHNDATLWNTRDFSCANASYNANLYIRGDTKRDAHIDLILCNQGNGSVNGLVVRLELVDEPSIFGSRRRNALISMEYGDTKLGRQLFNKETHMSGFVYFSLWIDITPKEIRVSLGGVEVLRARNPIMPSRGFAAVRFAPAKPNASKMLGLGRFRVFQ